MRMRSGARATVLSIVVSVFALTAAAQTTTTPQTARPAARRGPSDFQQAMNDGNRLMVARDFDGALEAYRRAATLQGDSGEPHLFIGYAQRAKGRNGEALESFRTAARLASSDDATKGKALFNIAAVLEAQHELDAARGAWQEYISFAESHATVTTYPGSGRARVTAVDRVKELDHTYEDVRRRIAERERENASRH